MPNHHRFIIILALTLLAGCHARHRADPFATPPEPETVAAASSAAYTPPDLLMVEDHALDGEAPGGLDALLERRSCEVAREIAAAAEIGDDHLVSYLLKRVRTLESHRARHVCEVSP